MSMHTFILVRPLPRHLYRARRLATRPLTARLTQRGITLIELMIGLLIGLLVVGVAIAALMASRGVSGTVSDASAIHQQGAYAMRVIGQQLRQAGSLYLNPNPGGAVAANRMGAAVAFEVQADGSGNNFDPSTDTLFDSPGTLNIGYRRYADPVFTGTTAQSLSRNCVGGPGDGATGDAYQRLESIFELSGTDLVCGGNDTRNGRQPVVQNVASFQVRYLVQDAASTLGSPTLRYRAASSMTATDWSRAQAVEVCLVIFGNERMDLPAGSTYLDCDNNPVNLSTLTGARQQRMHMMFRNVFQLRSQGLVGSVI
ncbi:MAG: PilW family protein [Pseudomonadota bacterium]|nr:PilW family protein [Pseudomonadota bacterium]